MKMQALDRRTQALRGLAGSVDIVGPLDIAGPGGVSTSLGMQNERKNRELCWGSRSPAKPVGLVDESVELVLPSCDNAPRLLKLMGRLENRLHEHDSYGSVMRTAHLWDGSVTIKILMQPTKFSSLVIKLANMSEVERVEEGSHITNAFSSFPDEFGGSLVSNSRPTKSVRVTLKEADIARQEPQRLN